MLEKQNFLLKAYFKKLISNYCLEDKNQISKFKFSELIELPLVISDRFWNIIISKTKAENNFKIEEYSHEIEKLPKNILVNNLISIYISIFNHDSDFLFEFLDIDENNVLIKSGVKFIYRNIYVHKYKTINGFEEKIYSEINKSFNNTKIILKKELNEKFSSSLIEFLFDFLINLKLFKNFETIKTLCDITVDDINYKNNLIYLKLIEENHFDIENNYFADKRDDENEYNNNIQNITQETLDISENGEYNNLSYKSYYNKQRKVSLSFKNINISSQVLKENILDKKIKKESFQIEKPEQYHLIGSEEEKINQKYIEHNYSLFNKNFFCLINQYYYTYKFFIHNGYIFYFKLSPKNNLFIFDGVILISNTHLKKKFEKIEDTNPPLYKSSIISHVCFENLNTDIYTYNTTDFIEFSDELMKYSRYKRFKDNYEIIKEIGRGSFSIVYLVKNILYNKLYAVKKIDKDNILDDYKYYSMEYWEKNIFDYIKNVPNNNIVKSIEYFENSDYIFFIYEYLPDGMITKYTKDIIKGVYNGLLYLYKNGIIHRDIKAKNIIMKNNIPFIIDFGLSKMQSKINLCYESYGTLEYLAPEVLEGKGYNHKCDVWSFGVMLHTLKYGRVPFYSDKPDNDDNYKEEIINKIFGEEYIKKEDTDYDNLIEICLVKSNIDRNKISQIKRWINRFS
jgi:hypothetical protein